MATARFDFRIDPRVKSRIAKASALIGEKSITDYAARVLDEDASKIIEQHESMTVEGDLFDRFLDACDKSAKPNKALQSAKAFADENAIK